MDVFYTFVVPKYFAVMDFLRTNSKFRLLFGTLLVGVLVCLCFKGLWTVQQTTSGSLPPLRENDSSIDYRRVFMQDAGAEYCRREEYESCLRSSQDTCTNDGTVNMDAGDEHYLKGDEHYWREEYESRLQRARYTCNNDATVNMVHFWRSHANRKNGRKTSCDTKLCPIIVIEQQLLFCFIPKVASSHIKRFFLNISNILINDTLKYNGTAMHIAANEALRRISPMYFPSTKFEHLYKIVFVRHPFDRLVSAFRSKAERSRAEVPYFYSRYWDPIMKRLRPSDAILDQITFEEFVWYLTHTDTREYDEHWAPFWSRCNPCLVEYDFIGKLETSQHDFLYAFQEAGIEFDPEWWIGFQPTDHEVTLRYFAMLPNYMIQSLYMVYKFDFEVFGYSVDEFLPERKTT